MSETTQMEKVALDAHRSGGGVISGTVEMPNKEKHQTLMLGNLSVTGIGLLMNNYINEYSQNMCW